MVMQRRDRKNALAEQLEGSDLHDHRKRFQHEQSADDAQDDLVFRENAHRAQGSAHRQRSRVAHEDACRRRVEP